MVKFFIATKRNIRIQKTNRNKRATGKSEATYEAIPTDTPSLASSSATPLASRST